MKYKLIYIFAIACLSVSAQSADEAQRLFNNGQYAEAGEIYNALLKRNPRNELNNYRYARCCYETGKLELAMAHFEMSGERYPLKNFYLGELYFMSYEFKKSAEAYTKYLPTLEAKDERIPEIEKRLKQTEFANRLLSRVEDIAVIDSMIVDKEDFLNHYHFSNELGTLQQERVFFDSCRTENKITYTTQRKDRVYFSDSIEGRMDIFTSYRLLNDWSIASPLSNIINSSANENYPFLLLDGVTMYFASNGENSIGGYDIFVTKYIPSTNTYLTPENIGMPFNSPYNDYMMVIDEINKTGWFATDRYQPTDKVALYFFILNDSKIILQSDNEEEIRLAAQLKTFREANVSKNIRIVQKADSNDSEKEFEFVITDNLIYTNSSQFKSKDALKAWKEMNKLAVQMVNMKEQLKILREDYAKVNTESERSIISPKILLLENKIQEQDELILQKTITVRNEEIKSKKNNRQ